jgi:hypothetical protein
MCWQRYIGPLQLNNQLQLNHAAVRERSTVALLFALCAGWCMSHI